MLIPSLLKLRSRRLHAKHQTKSIRSPSSASHAQSRRGKFSHRLLGTTFFGRPRIRRLQNEEEGRDFATGGSHRGDQKGREKKKIAVREGGGGQEREEEKVLGTKPI